MRKRFLKISMVAAILLMLGTAVTVWHNNPAFAKKQTANVKSTAAGNMAKYSLKKKTKQNSGAPIRRSRLNQINVISEAANVLNLLPINIMDEMKKGKTLVQIAQDKGLSKDQFLQKLADFDTKTIDAASSTGTISQEHKTALKEGQKDRLNYNIGLKSVDVNDHQAMDMNH